MHHTVGYHSQMLFGLSLSTELASLLMHSNLRPPQMGDTQYQVRIVPKKGLPALPWLNSVLSPGLFIGFIFFIKRLPFCWFHTCTQYTVTVS